MMTRPFRLAVAAALIVGSASAASAQPPSSWTGRSSVSRGSSTSSQAYFTGASIRRSSYESEHRTFYGPGSRPWRTQKVELAPNDCGPRSFQVVNAGHAEAPCVGTTARR